MSRIGKKPIPVPSGVQVIVKDHTVTTKGPKGELSWRFPEEITVQADSGAGLIVVGRADDSNRVKALHGLTRALIANMVAGVSKGYEKKLEIYGTGYSCQVKGGKFLLNCGYMGRGVDAEGKPREAQFVIDIPKGLTVTVEVPTARGESEPARFTVTGADKQLIGQFTSELRLIRPPEPYKGKGLRFAGEHVRRKQGKAFAGGAT
ncbi:MAG: 50S ribosomal protein L6 [Phycisphaerae bacterium]